MIETRAKLTIRIATAACLAAAAPAAAADGFPKIAPAQVAEWQERGEAFLLVDVRPPQLYEAKHARGAMSLPAFALAAKPLPRSARVVLYDGGAGGAEAEKAAASLQARGHPEFYVMEGGLTAWEAQGLPVVAPPGASAAPLVDGVAPEDLLRMVDSGARAAILDLRSADLHRQSRIPGAASAATEALFERAVARLGPADVVVLYDEDGAEARERAESLRRRGFLAAKYLLGGMLAWREKNMRVER